MELRFVGQNGSMGLRFGQTYRVSVESKDDGTTMMTRPIRCPYASDAAFARNWIDPRFELRTVMEARGRELRQTYIPAEQEQVAQKNSDAPMEEGMLEEQRTGEDA